MDFRRKRRQASGIRTHEGSTSIDTATPTPCLTNKFLKAYAKPRGLTVEDAEAEICEILQRLARVVAKGFHIPGHDYFDLVQQAILITLEAIKAGDYDPARSLEGFAYSHMKNRLNNYRRDHYYRASPPCKCCDPNDPPDLPCQKFSDWQERNRKKINLANAIDHDFVDDEKESRMRTFETLQEDVEFKELLQRIDNQLPVELRRDYLRLREGRGVPPKQREAIRVEISRILGLSADGEA